MSFTNYKYLSKILREVYIRANAALKAYEIRSWEVSYSYDEYCIKFYAVGDFKYDTIYIESEINGSKEKTVAKEFIMKIRQDCSKELKRMKEEAKNNMDWMETDFRIAKDDDSHFIVSSLELFLDTLDSINLK